MTNKKTKFIEKQNYFPKWVSAMEFQSKTYCYVSEISNIYFNIDSAKFIKILKSLNLLDKNSKPTAKARKLFSDELSIFYHVYENKLLFSKKIVDYLQKLPGKNGIYFLVNGLTNALIQLKLCQDKVARAEAVKNGENDGLLNDTNASLDPNQYLNLGFFTGFYTLQVSSLLEKIELLTEDDKKSLGLEIIQIFKKDKTKELLNYSLQKIKSYQNSTFGTIIEMYLLNQKIFKSNKNIKTKKNFV